ncbi:MAG: hypothetical protein U0575_10555 [Phycisphaerales bacterium]
MRNCSQPLSSAAASGAVAIRPSLALGLTFAIIVGAATDIASAAAIPPDDLFFAPSSLVEAVYPRHPYFGDGATVPWTFSWTIADILARDPGRVDITLTGVQILPILVPNPGPFDEEGEYTDLDLAAITVANYPGYYAFTPGPSIFAPGTQYSADLSGNVIVVQVVAHGPWTFRVLTTSRPFPGGPIEAVSYVYSVLLGDEYAVLANHAPIPAHVHRQMPVDDIADGVAGPPGTVHVVSDGDPDDNGFLKDACETLMDMNKDPKKATSIADLVQKVCDAATANGGPVQLNLFAHGNGPTGDTANGIVKVGTEYICCGDGCTKKPRKLGECLKGKVSQIVLYSCYVGSDDDFMQGLANGAGVPTAGWRLPVTCAKKSTFLGFTITDGYFDVGAKDKKKKKEKQGCTESPCLGDLDVSDAVNGADLGLMLGNWGGTGCGDLNGDQVVDGSDLGILLGAWGPCPDNHIPTCGPGAGSCCAAHGGAGCADAGCCASVCSLDPSCCDNQWDAACAAEAANQPNCGCFSKPVCGGSANDCCSAGESPGCSVAACCEGVCTVDNYCCQAQWDDVCAGEAAGLCGSLCNTTCPGGAPEGEPCGADLNGGCNSAPPAFTPAFLGQAICGSFWAHGGERDTDWYLINLPQPTLVQVALVSAFPSALFILDTNCADPQILGQGSGGNPNTAFACLPPGPYLIFVSTQSFDGLPCGASNNYVLSITGQPQGCGGEP